jgi:hypothetical protein
LVPKAELPIKHTNDEEAVQLVSDGPRRPGRRPVFERWRLGVESASASKYTERH